MNQTITRDQWLSEFERVMRQQRRSDEGLTSQEIADALGITPHRVNYLLRAAYRAGRLKVGRKPAMAMDGRRCVAPCYQLISGGVATQPKAAKRR